MQSPYLNELEQDKLATFVEDKVMKEAVRKVLLEGIYGIGILKEGQPWDNRNWAFNLGGLNDMVMDDEKVGKLLKITTRAFAIVEDAFEKLSNFKKETPAKEEEVNPGL